MGPGENFRTPLPNSTNYLSAYDRRGRLLRQADDKEAKSADPESVDSRALEAAARSGKLEKEDMKDLRPFPLNDNFQSQSVLSDELRTEIWKRVKVDGKSVRAVSVELGVEMRRVGAVVRLVELEKRMKAEVRKKTALRSTFTLYDEHKNRLVLQTSIMVIANKTNYNSLTSTTSKSSQYSTARHMS